MIASTEKLADKFVVTLEIPNAIPAKVYEKQAALRQATHTVLYRLQDIFGMTEQQVRSTFWNGV